jgi:hypothetical protein
VICSFLSYKSHHQHCCMVNSHQLAMIDCISSCYYNRFNKKHPWIHHSIDLLGRLIADLNVIHTHSSLIELNTISSRVCITFKACVIHTSLCIGNLTTMIHDSHLTTNRTIQYARIKAISSRNRVDRLSVMDIKQIRLIAFGLSSRERLATEFICYSVVKYGRNTNDALNRFN